MDYLTDYLTVALITFILVGGIWCAWLSEIEKETDLFPYIIVVLASTVVGCAWPFVVVLFCGAVPIYLVMLVVKKLLNQFYK